MAEMYKTTGGSDGTLGGMNDTAHPATGKHTTDGRPHGFSALTPHIVTSPAKGAIAFYRDVFGATVEGVTEMGGAVAHAQLDFGAGKITLSDPLDGYGLRAPDPSGGVTYSLALYVPHVDQVVHRALEHGATLREPVVTFVSGDRYGSLLDPFGVRWTVMTRVEDLSEEESARRVEAWARSMAEERTAD